MSRSLARKSLGLILVSHLAGYLLDSTFTRIRDLYRKIVNMLGLIASESTKLLELSLSFLLDPLGL